jgi:hypothetical protein
LFKSVQDEASEKWGQAVCSKKPKPAVWTPNVTYQFGLKAELAVPVVSAEIWDSLARQKGTDKMAVTITMVDGIDQLREDNITTRNYASTHDIIDASWTNMRSRSHAQE